ncbi:MAG TPA: class I tRNA ligase family protein [Candidatus Acidoferrum sp.]|nr:class I tRNA ligase family protein [Candidatus Acidoferrum sp.]
MLNLYNSLTRKIEPFSPAEDMKVKMYTCGPSTYQKAHIGNYRTFLFEDITLRYMEYLGYKVTRLITLTDVEDKAITQAKKENLSVEQLTTKNEAIFFADFKLLRIKKPDFAIRASSVVDQAVNIIIQLLDKGTAYWFSHEDSKNVYFDPLKFKGFGKLANLDMSKWPKKKRRFHLDTYPGTPWNMGDFVIWHGCGLENVCYDTLIGRGRPAWNIQDAAIVTKHLGFSIDVACGGIDNLVRHHDYALAIAESVSGIPFSRYWLHGAHLFVNGKKMSKSTGNVYYPSDIMEQGVDGDHLRFFLIYGPYRKKLNFTFEKLAKTTQRLDSFRRMLREIQGSNSETNVNEKALINKIVAEFEDHMNNDLDVKGAFDCLNETISELHKNRELLSKKDVKNLMEDLHRIDSVLQCIF